MSSTIPDRKRKRGAGPKLSKKQRRIEAYHSSSSEDEDDETGVQMPTQEGKSAGDIQEEEHSSEGYSSVEDDEEAEEEDDLSSDNDTPVTGDTSSRKIKKRNDPTAFANSLSKILNSKLTGTQRADPILSRSATASTTAKALADSKLEAKAKRKLRDEKRALREKGHVADVLGTETADVEAAVVAEEEKRLRKTAQRGVVKLFNAVMAAQVKAEEATREAREGTSGIGIQKKQERINEMSKKGFLELLSGEGTAA